MTGLLTKSTFVNVLGLADDIMNRRIMKLIWYILLPLVLMAAADTLAEADLFYPAGHSLSASYEASHTSMTVSDTLVLSRSLVNGESYALTSLYFADNLPPEFSVISYTLTRNGGPIGCGFSGPNADTVLPGYDAYQWVVDWPDAFGGLQTEIISDDSLHLEVMVTCDEAGSYSLPLHTLVCCGNNGQMFAVLSTSVSITVDASVSIDEDNPDVLPDGFLTTRAYPNPFNASVTVKATGMSLTDKRAGLTIFNSLGQVVHSDTQPTDRGDVVFDWTPSEEIGSGMYLYRLSTASAQAEGKVVLLK